MKEDAIYEERTIEKMPNGGELTARSIWKKSDLEEGAKLYEEENIKQFIRTHREKFDQYWSLNSNESQLLEDFVEQFCRFISKDLEEAKKEKLKEVLNDMMEDDA